MSTLLLYDERPSQIPRCFDNTIRIMVMGDNRSGKTSFILRCINGAYRDIESGLYLEDIYRRPLNLPLLLSDNRFSRDLNVKKFLNSNIYDKKSLPKEVQFLDASPFEIADFSELRNRQIIQSDAFILCFDPTSLESFLNLRTYQRRIEKVRGIDDRVPIMIVSTKSDLMLERKVSSEDILEMLSRIELSYDDDFLEISSKHNTNIKKLFVNTLIKVEKYKYDEQIALEKQDSRKNQSNTEGYKDDELISTSDTDFVRPTSATKRDPSIIKYSKDTDKSLLLNQDSKAGLIEIKGDQEMKGKTSSRSIRMVKERTHTLGTTKNKHSDLCCIIC